MMFVSQGAEEKGQQRAIRWISLDGSSSSEKVSTVDICLAHLNSVVQGAMPNECDLSFCDPDLPDVYKEFNCLRGFTTTF